MLSRQVASSARTMSSQRFFSTASIAASEGKGQPLSEKEKAHENQWAQKHDAEKLQALRKALEDQEKVTQKLKQDLENLEKGKSS
ncbi:hypothetical protein O0I10_011170 [Lichtheimia ornata]|uniref:Mitochondrial ATPase inhibitor n=1 Tax=Lichtheimia ornata TaxID=688661 RepID=A0AAD7UV55_9FUNG|nr:uncharacterized protein O0I10_011170 [Lichtheimia ornata]KAJ8653222.1 hypothetical protein O0I10_011170 [Lichtheimia ornata]